MTKREFLEWGGSVWGLLGAGLLALNNEYSGWGFVAFLVSNGHWIGFSLLSRIKGLLIMQIGFTITSLIGIWRWLVA